LMLRPLSPSRCMAGSGLRPRVGVGMAATQRPHGAAAALREVEVEKLLQENARLQERVRVLEHEKADVQGRLEFVEELLGPTEAQRRILQDKANNARAAALQARRSGANVPVRSVGRIDEPWLQGLGLTERDCALLQRGCVTGADGVPRDVSLLGDPAFRPFDEATKAPRWEARGGALKLSLGDVRSRWGEAVALEVVRCAVELERYDASRRLGVELPWHEAESRELEAAEVIAIMERELAETKRIRSGGCCPAGEGEALRGRHMLHDVEAASSVDTRSRPGGGFDDDYDDDSRTIDSSDSSMSYLCDSSTHEGGNLATSWSAASVADNLRAVHAAACADASVAGSSLQVLPNSSDGGASEARGIGGETRVSGSEPEEIECGPGDDGSEVAVESLWRPALFIEQQNVAYDAEASPVAPGKTSRDISKSITATPRTARGSLALRQESAGDASSPGTDVDSGPDCGDEGFADVLRELLEGEVAESLGRWLGPSASP